MSAGLIRKEWTKINRKAAVEPNRKPQIRATTTTETKREVGRSLQPAQQNGTLFLNHTGTEFMQLHGSTVVMASENAAANPLIIVLVMMSIFLFMTLSVTVAIIVFCRKKNAVFVLQKCEQEDEVSYELDDMNNTDIEFADFKGEHEAMMGKPRKSATCPDLAECLDGDDPASLQRLLDTESETDDSGTQQRSPVRAKLKQRSNSFTFQNVGCHGYQKMIVTAVMEIGSANKMDDKCRNNSASEYGDNFVPDENTLNKRISNEPNIYKASQIGEALQSQRPVGQKSITHSVACFNDAKLAFLGFDANTNLNKSLVGLPVTKKINDAANYGVCTLPKEKSMGPNCEKRQNYEEHFWKTSSENCLHQQNYSQPNKTDIKINLNCMESVRQNLEPNAGKSTDTRKFSFILSRDLNKTEINQSKDYLEHNESNSLMQTSLDKSIVMTEEFGQLPSQSQNGFQNSKICQTAKNKGVKRKQYSIPTSVSNLTNETEPNKRFNKAADQSETVKQITVETKSKDADNVTDTTGLLE